MPRIIDAELQDAIDAGTGTPFFRAYFWTGAAYVFAQPLKYEIFNLRASVTIVFDPALANAQWFFISRGLIIDGLDYVVESSIYHSEKIAMDLRSTLTFDGHMFEDLYVSVTADDTVSNVLADAIAQTLQATTLVHYGNVTSLDAARWWYGIQFDAAGTTLTTRARSLEGIFKQRYLAQLVEVGENLIKVADSSQFEDTPLWTFDYRTVMNASRVFTYNGARNFVWMDETGTQHESGLSTWPTHNLGYIESTEDPSDAFGPNAQIQEFVILTVAMPQLALTNGDPIDIIYPDSSTTTAHTGTIHVLVREVFDPDQDPAWYQQLFPIQWVEDQSSPPQDVPKTTYGRWKAKQQLTHRTKDQKNTDAAGAAATGGAGALPIHIKYKAVGLLGKEPTVEDALQTINTHAHTGIYAPVTKGVTNGDNHDHVGGDGKALTYAVPLPSNALNGTIAAGATMTLPFYSFALNVSRVNLLVTRAGTLKNLYLRTATSQPGTGSLVATVVKNNVASAFTLTIAANAVSAVYSNTSSTLSVANGDLIAVDIKNNASGASAQIGALVLDLECNTSA